MLRSGCAWVSGRYLPAEYGPWPTVYYYLRRWRLDGTGEQIHTQLREVVREHMGRERTPSAAIIDRQTVKTTASACHRQGTGVPGGYPLVPRSSYPPMSSSYTPFRRNAYSGVGGVITDIALHKAVDYTDVHNPTRPRPTPCLFAFCCGSVGSSMSGGGDTHCAGFSNAPYCWLDF